MHELVTPQPNLNDWQRRANRGDPGSAIHPAGTAAGWAMLLTGGKRTDAAKWGTGLRFAVLVFMVWTAVGLFEAVPELFITSPRLAFLGKLIDNWTWALLTPALILIDRRLAATRTSIGRSVALFLLLSVPFSLVHTYLTGLILYPLPEVWWNPLRNKDFVIYYFVGGWVTYCAVIAILLASRFYNRFLTGRLQLERVERSLIESRLDALRLHLEPHFLFNTLNAISSEVAGNPALAREMIADLGALLRRSLDCQDKAEITLAQELALLEHYLSIQRVRFGDRMEIMIDVEPDLLSARVPSMLLQPLVENAIRHGIEGRMSGGKILVRGIKAGDQLQLEVVDNGVGLPRAWRMDRSTGHGLRVTRERLSALYPASAEQCLSIRRREGGGTQATIRIPLSTAGAHAAVA